MSIYIYIYIYGILKKKKYKHIYKYIYLFKDIINNESINMDKITLINNTIKTIL